MPPITIEERVFEAVMGRTQFRDGWNGQILVFTLKMGHYPVTVSDVLTRRTRVRSNFIRALARTDYVERILVEGPTLIIGHNAPDERVGTLAKDIGRIINDHIQPKAAS